MSNTQGPFPGSPMRPNGEYMYLSRLYAGLSANTYSIFKITFQNTTQAPLLSSGFRTSIRLNIDSSATKNYNYYMVYPPEPDEPYPVYYEEAIPNATYLAQNTTYAIKVTYRSGVAETYDINTTLPEGRARSEKVQSIEILATLPEAPQYNDINVWQTIQFELGIFVFNPTITTGDAPGHRTDPQPPPPPPSNPTIVGIAQRFVGRLTYTMSSARSQLPSLNGTDVGYADCSSYVAHVLNLAGYTNFSAAGDYTATLVTKLTNMGKIIAYSFDSSMMQPGDILIMSENSTAGEGAASHAAIFFGTYNGATNQLIECYGKGGSNNAAITGFLTSYNRAGRFDYKWLARM